MIKFLFPILFLVLLPAAVHGSMTASQLKIDITESLSEQEAIYPYLFLGKAELLTKVTEDGFLLYKEEPAKTGTIYYFKPLNSNIVILRMSCFVNAEGKCAGFSYLYKKKNLPKPLSKYLKEHCLATGGYYITNDNNKVKIEVNKSSANAVVYFSLSEASPNERK